MKRNKTNKVFYGKRSHAAYHATVERILKDFKFLCNILAREQSTCNISIHVNPEILHTPGCRARNLHVRDEVERNFSKKFEFFQENDDRWSLPDPKTMFKHEAWQDENLTKLKSQLNELKQQLNDKDIELWRRHTEHVAIAGLVKNVVKERIRPELCTQAWLKFYEIISSYPLVSQTQDTKAYLGTVHLCEAPGAFVSALNHYVQSHRSNQTPWSNIQEWRWLATTLNPYYEGNSMGATVVDDRLILPTLLNWDFGADNTGNIMSKENRKSLSERANKHLQQVSLVTADGSIDCQENPSEQEEMVSRLHLSETTAALRILAAGGNLVIKMFTFFENTSICIMYLLNCSFEKVHVFKPGTSKPGNSEVYVIAINYHGSNVIKEHIEVLENHTGVMFSREDLHPSYLQQLQECAEFFKEHQQVAIETNLMLFQNMRMVNKQHHDSVRYCAAQFYIENYKVRPIRQDQRLVQQNLQAKVSEFTKMRRGSLNSRRKVVMMNRDERIALLDAQLKEINKDKVDVCANIIIPVPPNGNSPEETLPDDPLMGKTFKDIIGSPFCSRHLLILWREVCSYHVKIGSRLAEDIGSLSEEILRLSDNLGQSKVVNCSSGSHILDLLCQKVTKSSCKEGEEESRSTTYIMGPICNDLDAFLLPVIAKNDNTIIMLHDALTRIYAGIIFLLHLAFQQVFLVSAPTGPPIAVCCGFQELSNTLLRKLARVAATAPNADPETSILEFVPYDVIARNKPLADTLDAFNNHYLMQKCLVAIESLKSDAATMLTE